MKGLGGRRERREGGGRSKRVVGGGLVGGSVLRSAEGTK
jgi:hypothetical protein